MNKKSLCIMSFFIVLLLVLPSSINAITFSNRAKKLDIIFPTFGMDVVDVSYQDAFYNGTNLSYPLEWYYFDSALSDGYSVEFHIICGPHDDVGVVAPMINVYKDGEMIFHDDQYHFVRNFDASDNSMKVWFDDQLIIDGAMKDNDEWDLFLNYSVDDFSVSLGFKSVSQAWKAMVLDMWWWAVLVPNSMVEGTITVDNETVDVSGNGYVEHAWEGRLPSVWGWFWGKFIGTNYSIIWSEIFKNPFQRHLVMVLNEAGSGYFSIPHEDISIQFSDYHFFDGWLIPQTFDFSVVNERIKLDLTARSESIIHQTSIVSFNYWRYHVHITGTIEYDGVVEEIDNLQIMDLTRFY